MASASEITQRIRRPRGPAQIVTRFPPPPPLPGARRRRLVNSFIWSTYAFALAVGWTMSAITLSFTAGLTASMLVAFAEFTNRLRSDSEDRSDEP